MLDVHPPHTPTHTWRDFFIHIATIVIGLLIAVGLEQAVEGIHHHYEVREARERIREEIKVNIEIDQRDLTFADALLAQMDTNIAALRAREAGKQPAVDHLSFDLHTQTGYDAAFAYARDKGVLAMMPYEEGAMYSDAYGAVAVNHQQAGSMITAIGLAKGAARDHNLSELTPAELQAVLTACANAKQEATLYKKLHGLSLQEWKAALSGNYRTDFHG
ncbi:MAG: hypothetical protein ABR971_05365 [Acidobacteriaceae bacterium]|jgi:hypothetical protein